MKLLLPINLLLLLVVEPAYSRLRQKVTPPPDSLVETDTTVDDEKTTNAVVPGTSDSPDNHAPIEGSSVDNPTLSTTYVGEMVLDLKSPQIVDGGKLLVFETAGGDITGSISGSEISGKAATPAGDWFRLDGLIGTANVRGSFLMDDQTVMYMESSGRALMNPSGDGSVDYLVTTPLFETSSEKYSFMHNYQFIAQVKSATAPNSEGLFTLAYALYILN